MTEHDNGTLVCHYCGERRKKPATCPSCGSKYIAGFGTGTQKIEEGVKKIFPEARVLRMDADTTKKKESYSEILSSFSRGEADILVGTQMIVKGHDFPNVTLVGILAQSPFSLINSPAAPAISCAALSARASFTERIRTTITWDTGG